MLKSFYILAVILLSFSLSLPAQNKSLCLNIANSYYGDHSLGFDHRLTGRFSMSEWIFLYYRNMRIQNTDYHYRGYGVTIDTRYHFFPYQNNLPEGFYMAPFIHYRAMNLEAESFITDPLSGKQHGKGKIKGDYSGIGFCMGYHWLVYKRLFFDGFIGLGWLMGGNNNYVYVLYPNGYEEGTNMNLKADKLMTRMGVCIGLVL